MFSFATNIRTCQDDEGINKEDEDRLRTSRGEERTFTSGGRKQSAPSRRIISRFVCTCCENTFRCNVRCLRVDFVPGFIVAGGLRGTPVSGGLPARFIAPDQFDVF